MYFKVWSSSLHSTIHNFSLSCKTITRLYPCYFAVIMFFLPFHARFPFCFTYSNLFSPSAPQHPGIWFHVHLQCTRKSHGPSVSFHLVLPSILHTSLLRLQLLCHSPGHSTTLVKSNSWPTSSWSRCGAYKGMGLWPLRIKTNQTWLGLLGREMFYFHFCGVSGWQDVSSGVSVAVHPASRPTYKRPLLWSSFQLYFFPLVNESPWPWVCTRQSLWHPLTQEPRTLEFSV